jgi:hypothetical protein
MSNLLPPTIFGWPLIILSLLASAVGLVTKRYWLLLVGAVLIIPFSYYLGNAPGIGVLAYFLPVFQACAAYAIRIKHLLIAWILAAPAFVVSAWAAVLVLAQ